MKAASLFSLPSPFLPFISHKSILMSSGCVQPSPAPPFPLPPPPPPFFVSPGASKLLVFWLLGILALVKVFTRILSSELLCRPLNPLVGRCQDISYSHEEVRGFLMSDRHVLDWSSLPKVSWFSLSRKVKSEHFFLFEFSLESGSWTFLLQVLSTTHRSSGRSPSHHPQAATKMLPKLLFASQQSCVFLLKILLLWMFLLLSPFLLTSTMV